MTGNLNTVHVARGPSGKGDSETTCCNFGQKGTCS